LGILGLRFGFCYGRWTYISTEAAGMKPINPFPLIIMLILVCFLIYWVLYR
jgi:hypothetical protein